MNKNSQKKPPLSLFGLSPENLVEALDLEKSFQGKQIFKWIAGGASSFNEMTNLSKSERERLSAFMPSTYSSKVINTQVDETGATKLAIELYDGEVIECVLLKDKDDKLSACLSSQVGCAMGCKFCRTGTMGFHRNLASEEIIEQFAHLSKLGKITHIVYMGMGEPMANMGPVLSSIRYFHREDTYFISLRRITISTCGVVNGIRELTELDFPVKLAVSLVSADDRIRSSIMPVNDKWNLKVLRQSLLHFQAKGGKKITLEYCMLSGVNCDERAAERLAAFTRGMLCTVNLIPWNPAAELPWSTPSSDEINRFCMYLEDFHINYVRRYTKGRNINGACGQLATKVTLQEKSNMEKIEL